MQATENMARPNGETSNSLFGVLAEWNAYLEHRYARHHKERT
jgi:hypothetical protein